MNKEEKSLTIVNENSLINKIKHFIRNIFNNKKVEMEKKDNENQVKNSSTNNSFIENIKNNSENDETRLLKLQKQFENGQIKVEQLSEQQRKQLNELYDRQIAHLKHSIEIRKKRILQYKRKYQIVS